MLAERDGDVLGGPDRDRARQRHPAASQLAEADRVAAHHDDPHDLGTASTEGLDRDLQIRAVPQLERAPDDRQPSRILAEVLAQAPPCLVFGCRRVTLRPGVELLDRACELLGLHPFMLAAGGEPVSPEDHPWWVTPAQRFESTIEDVTQDKAIERVRRLREITVERGATLHEATTAAALAAQLTERHGLDRPASSRHDVARYATSAGDDRRSSRSLRFVAFA